MKESVKKYLKQFDTEIDFKTNNTIIRDIDGNGKQAIISDILLNGGYTSEGICEVSGISFGSVKISPIPLYKLKKLLRTNI